MTGTDPAVEAARLAAASGWDVLYCEFSQEDLVTAAREALAPIRELHRGEPYAQGPDYCEECEHQWPCPTARLIYSETELTND
ncbi:hypothetical protein GMA1_52 [Gordonia phage GMA1]|uniref:hypothetical protein n=1 Tax=Gordonia phage GMA1 TaxID=1647470 RepID=UPI0007B60EDD|nr:hypothetical protein BH788_gp52 [Gordonia phage GMA1]AKJ72149.1 hypothetical protein GMA1_52 [Gordonia phage GMA1]